MLDNQTSQRLRAMKLNVFAMEFELQLQDDESYYKLRFEKRM